MATGGVAIPEAWKELVRSLGTEQLVDAIYVALDDFNAREHDTIPPELWRRLGDRAAAYKNPFVSDGSGSGEGEIERIKIKLVAVGGEDGGRTSSDSSEVAVVELLRALQAVPMTFETLEATNIGKTISGLRKHSSEKVRGLAAALYKNWKALVDEHLSRSSNKPPAPAKTASALTSADHAKKNTAAADKAAPAAAPTKTAAYGAAADHSKKNTTAADKPVPAAAPKTTACNKRKEAPAQEEAKLEATRKKLRERYREEETAKMQRKIQMINTPGDAKQRPVVVERRRVVRDTGVAMANRAPVRSSLRT